MGRENGTDSSGRPMQGGKPGKNPMMRGHPSKRRMNVDNVNMGGTGSNRNVDQSLLKQAVNSFNEFGEKKA